MFDVGWKHKLEHCDCCDWRAKKKKMMEWNLKLWTLQRERKRQTARERKKMKLAFSSGPSLDDQSLLLEPLTFFLEEHFALPHKSLWKHTTPPHHHLSAGGEQWELVILSLFGQITWTSLTSDTDMRTHTLRLICVCVRATPPAASTLISQLDPPPHLALTEYTCWASSSQSAVL